MLIPWRIIANSARLSLLVPNFARFQVCQKFFDFFSRTSFYKTQNFKVIKQSCSVHFFVENKISTIQNGTILSRRWYQDNSIIIVLGFIFNWENSSYICFFDVYCEKFKKCKGFERVHWLFEKKFQKNFFIAYSVLKLFKTLKSAFVLKIMFSTSPWISWRKYIDYYWGFL